MIRIALSLANGLSGAALLAAGRAEGLGRVEQGRAGAARSFCAALIALPILLCLRLIDWTVSGQPSVPGVALARDLLTFVIGWAGFAVLSHHLAVALGRAERWPAYIAVWNWCNVVQYALLLAAAIPVLLHAPAPVSEAAELIVLGWALWLEWFAARITLSISALPAASLVALDVTIGLALSAASASVSG